jgi:putative transcriptional regulator
MDEHVFRSELSPEEMEKNFQDFDFFGALTESLSEAADYAKNGSSTRVTVRKKHSPDVDVAAIRGAVHMTQKAFASVLGVSPRTVESWECRRSTPSPTARKLICLIRDDNAIVSKLERM